MESAVFTEEKTRSMGMVGRWIGHVAVHSLPTGGAFMRILHENPEKALRKIAVLANVLFAMGFSVHLLL